MTKRKVTVLVLILLFICAAVVTPALALLLHATIVDVEVDFGNINSDDVDFTQTRAEEATFNAPGDKVNYLYNITNNGANPVHYSLSISMTSQVNYDGQAVLIYCDNNFLGTLASLSAEGVFIIDNADYLLPGNGALSAAHNITLEYHNGAQGSFNAGKSVDIVVTLKASTIDYKANLIVTSGSELAMAVADVNNSIDYKSIRLSGEIKLDRNIVIARSTAIDFTNGYINFNGFSITVVSGEGVFTELKIISKSTVTATNILAESMIIDGEQAYINYCYNADMLASKMTIKSVNVTAVSDMLEREILSRMGNGYRAGNISRMLGANHHYLDNALIADADTMLSNGQSISYNSGKLDITSSGASYVAQLTLADRIVEIKVLGVNYMTSTGYIYDTIISRDLAHIEALTVESSNKDITYDIFLPVSLPKANATIRWVSDNNDIISDIGVCGSSVEGNVTLYAYININGDQFIKSYNMRVFKQSNQMRFDYLVARIGEQKLSALYDSSMPKGSYFILPVVKSGSPDDYRGMFNIPSLGLENLRYELSPVFNYLINSPNNKVSLVTYTFERNAEIRIYGKFSNELDKEYESTISIIIEPIDNPELHKQILDMLQDRLNNIDILALILKTRAELGMAQENAIFTLPGYYRGFNINIEVDADNPAGRAVLVETEQVEDRYYIITPNLEQFGSDIAIATLKATIVFAGELPGKETSSPLHFTVPRAINNNDIDINDKSLFYSIKVQMIQQMRDAGGNIHIGVPRLTSDNVTAELKAIDKNYILLVDLANMKKLIIEDGALTHGNSQSKLAVSDSNYYYYHSGNLNGVYDGLKKISELSDISVINNGSLLANQLAGEELFKFILAEYMLTRLDMVNCMLTSVDRIVQQPQLTRINLSSNPIVRYEWLYGLGNNAVSNIDITNTNFNISTQEPYLASVYFRYVNSDKGRVPAYYYGNKVLYVPMYSQATLEHINYLYCLKMQTVLNTAQLQLATRVIKMDKTYAPLAWQIMTTTAVVKIYTNSADGRPYMQVAGFNAASPPNGSITTTVILRANLAYSDAGTEKTVSRDFSIVVWHY